MNELGPYGISYAINAVFSEYISDISISQLYDICNYMIFLIAFSCTMEEKSSFMLLMANDAITSFLRMPNSEKLKHVVEWAKESELDTELDTELVGHDSFGFGYRPLENDKLLTPQFKPFGVDRPFSDAAEKWGLSDGAVLRNAVRRGYFKEGEYRQSGSTWLITKLAMERVYGK